MADVTKRHPVFLGFCRDALQRLEGDHSVEAGRLRRRLEGLVKELESWITAKQVPDTKELTIAAVLEAYREALALEANKTKAGT